MNTNSHSYKLLVVVGPSGVGKGTLISKLMEEFKDSFCFSVSHTTRQPRQGETNGVNYYFISKAEYSDKSSNGDFIEDNKYSDNYYGTSKEELNRISKLQKICILEIDINGANQILKSGLEAYYISILPPSIKDLENRLIARSKDSSAVIQDRVELSKMEIEKIDKADFFNYKIVNDDLNVCYEEFRKNITTLYPFLTK